MNFSYYHLYVFAKAIVAFSGCCCALCFWKGAIDAKGCVNAKSVVCLDVTMKYHHSGTREQNVLVSRISNTLRPWRDIYLAGAAHGHRNRIVSADHCVGHCAGHDAAHYVVYYFYAYFS